MASQTCIPSKSFWAKLALKWFFTSVCLIMVSQMRIPCEGLG
ncbi:unnamed protein product, partial [Ixodes pacificus]